jgi:hypothetical protein
MCVAVRSDPGPELVSAIALVPSLDVEDRARAGLRAARNVRHRGSLLRVVRIGELENGDLFVPVPAEFDAEGNVVDGIMCRIAADTDEHAGWMREVEAGRVELVRRDPTRKFAWVDGPRG